LLPKKKSSSFPPAPQSTGIVFSQCPDHRVENIRFPDPVVSDNHPDAGLEVHGGGFGKGFETFDADVA
jgi:hypothetical protein